MITDSYRVDQGPSTTIAAIANELTTNPQLYCATPLAQVAEQIYNLGVQYNVDPSFFLATTNSENIYGTYPTSAAYDCASGTGSYNWASISNGYYGGYPCPDINPRFGCYPTVIAGVEAFFKLITIEYYPRGQKTLGAIWWGVGGNCLPCNGDLCGGCIPPVPGTAYGPCTENYCSTFYDPNRYNGVLATMNRLAVVLGTQCPPGYVYDPGSGGCILDPNATDSSGTVDIVAALAGAGLLAAAGLLVWRST